MQSFFASSTFIPTVLLLDRYCVHYDPRIGLYTSREIRLWGVQYTADSILLVPLQLLKYIRRLSSSQVASTY